MQFHYVIGYDTDEQRWFVEYDSEAYFPDGHIFDSTLADATGYGWIPVLEDTSMDALIDQRCMNMLNALVSIWPAVDTNPMA